MLEHHVDFAEDLDQLGCSIGGCDHTTHDGEVYLHARCHLEAPTWSSYRAGVLTIWCAHCGRQVCAVAVAQRADAEP